MPAPESFATIIDTLASVRRDYHEKLKSIPQYEAFLLIESSTEKAAGALHGTDASSSSIATDVIDSLQYARTRFEQHMTSIPQYRVLVAIDKVIKEISQHLGLAAHEDAVAEPIPAPAAAADHHAPEAAAADAKAVDETAAATETATAGPEAELESAPADAADEAVQPEVAEETEVTADPAAADTDDEVKQAAEAPALRVVDAKSPSIVPADHDADASHDDDIVVLNAPAWEKSGRDAKDDITARLAAQAASAAISDADDAHDVSDTDLVVVSKREPSDHEAA
ncbi:hypothetical protein SSBR45G_04320 [Bradyrhizobium sp. SSBR45G]|uniref:hypothetical protein n=1 Tax=unclassified Bradyrhizobium TaxID=2631580 RepID=UPI002342AEF9|nr:MULTISPECIES: hypothetical protein [unclassified Bradyrhizobium]GLH75524.1 hypothetical protein SSBR45G_04320 [Bradyrhizobium sp. SSBR45G]GLH82689.1 hypothetical protein SSBR45R_01490 [Bradyrhizobium sp. SSBR45R]